MPTPQPITIGSTIEEFPAASWNALVDGYYRTLGTTPRGPVGDLGDGPVIVRIANKSGANIKAGGVLVLNGLLHEAGSTGNSRAMFNQPVFQGVTPADPGHFGDFVVLVDYIANNAVGRASIAGPTWVKCNVTNATHTQAKLLDTVADNLTSATDGRPIVYKELHATSGTGVQWCLMLLGAGGAGGTEKNLKRARAVTLLTAATDFSVAGAGTGTAVLLAADGSDLGDPFDCLNEYVGASIPENSNGRIVADGDGTWFVTSNCS